MTDLRQHPAVHLLTDLALFDVDESQSESLNRHLAVCLQCRAEYENVRQVMAHVAAAAPAARPPAGFTDRVLGAISDERAGQGRTHGVLETPRAARDRRSRRGRAQLAVAAAILSGIAVGAGGAVVLLERDGAADEVTAVGPALVTRDGTRVGTVLGSRFAGRPVIVMTLTSGDIGARYDCDLVLADGRREPAGTWVLREMAGATWVVPRPGGVTGVELLRDGSTWATATL